MATYNSTTKEWSIYLGGTKGYYNITLQSIINNDYAIKYDIDNTPTPEHFDNLNTMINELYEPLCTRYTVIIPILPSYVSPTLNKYLEIDNSSLHLFGKALDINAKLLNRNLSNNQMYEYIKNNLIYDQIIWVLGDDNEPEYVHISYDLENGNRGQILKLRTPESNIDIEIPYTTYIPDIE